MKKTVYVGNVAIGDGKIKIQSMTNTITSDISATKKQIIALKNAGADLVRISLPDEESAYAVRELVSCGIPLIGDVHFGHKPALIAIENGINKIRINPGNISKKSVAEIVKNAKQYNIPIRVGVNKGSVKGDASPENLAKLALDNAKLIEDLGYDNMVLAVKSSDVIETVSAYRILHKQTEYPLHIGLTEAGTENNGIIKSAIAIGSLLIDGIGDTIRVSLAGDPVKEIYAAKKILRASGIDKNYVNIVACPTCARTVIKVQEIAEKLEELTKDIQKPLTIAVMGCVVNGVGEGKHADFGVAGGKEYSVIFKEGKIYKKINNNEIFAELLNLIKE